MSIAEWHRDHISLVSHPFSLSVRLTLYQSTLNVLVILGLLSLWDVTLNDVIPAKRQLRQVATYNAVTRSRVATLYQGKIGNCTHKKMKNTKNKNQGCFTWCTSLRSINEQVYLDELIITGYYYIEILIINIMIILTAQNCHISRPTNISYRLA